jgi:hypothetical protein
MSWLFDRLCELATADQVEVVVDVDCRHGVHDLIDVLMRAAEVPQLTVAVTGGGVAHRIAIDLDDVPGDLRRLAFVDCLDAQLGEMTSSELILRGRSLTVDRPVERHHDDRWPTRRVVASDGRSGLDRLIGLDRRDLGIAVGAVSPAACLSVDDLLGVTSIIDALVTLRQFAFGSCAA